MCCFYRYLRKGLVWWHLMLKQMTAKVGTLILVVGLKVYHKHFMTAHRKIVSFIFPKTLIGQIVSSLSFSSDLVRGVHVHASVEQQSRETQEMRRPVLRLQSWVWSFACLVGFARQTKKKERLLVVYSLFLKVK